MGSCVSRMVFHGIFLTLVALLAAPSAWAQNVSISSPSNGQTVSSPFRVSGSATSSSTVTLMQIYLDGKKVHEVKGASITHDVSAASGSRRVTVQAYDSANRIFNSSVNVTVSGTTSTSSSTSSSSISDGVTISTPSNGQTVSSPFRVAGSASGATLMQIYLDGKKVSEVKGSSIDTSVSASTGTRRLTLQAYISGSWKRNSIEVNVGSSSTSTSSTVDGVTISSPGDGQSVSSPFRVAGSASGASMMQVYLDGNKVNEVKASSIDVSVSAAAGTRRLTVQALVSGSWKRNSISVNVGSTSTSSSGTTTSDSKKTYWNIDEMTGWEHCTKCAGRNGNGPVATYTMQQFISSPSMDGKSAKFSLTGGEPYSNALWWKQLGGNDSASNFVFELYYYITKPTASQALEFDVNQTRSADKRWYIFGTECDFKDRKVWKVWDTEAGTWRATSIPCNVPEAYKWHKVTLEFQRASGQTRFISVTINGQKHYFNRNYNVRPATWSTLNVAFQMDANSGPTPYDVWVDKMHLTTW